MLTAIVNKVALCLKAERGNVVVVFQSKYTTTVTFTLLNVTVVM